MQILEEYGAMIADSDSGYVNVGEKELDDLAQAVQRIVGSELAQAVFVEADEYVTWAQRLCGDNYNPENFISLKLASGAVEKIYGAAVFKDDDTDGGYVLKFGLGQAAFTVDENGNSPELGCKVVWSSEAQKSGTTEYAAITAKFVATDMEGVFKAPAINAFGVDPSPDEVESLILKGRSLSHFLRSSKGGGSRLVFMKDLQEGQTVTLHGVKPSPDSFGYTPYFLTSDIGDIVPNAKLKDMIENKVAAAYKIKPDAALDEAMALASRFYTGAVLTVLSRKEAKDGKVFVTTKVSPPAYSVGEPGAEDRNDAKAEPTSGIPF